MKTDYAMDYNNPKSQDKLHILEGMSQQTTLVITERQRMPTQLGQKAGIDRAKSNVMGSS